MDILFFVELVNCIIKESFCAPSIRALVTDLGYEYKDGVGGTFWVGTEDEWHQFNVLTHDTRTRYGTLSERRMGGIVLDGIYCCD